MIAGRGRFRYDGACREGNDMADSAGVPDRAYHPEMDGPAHEAAYNAFTHFTTVGVVFVVCIVAGLAVGGVKHSWMSAIAMIVLAHIATAIGLFSKTLTWRPPGVVLAILLLMLLLY